MMVHFHSMVDTSQPKQQGMAAGIRTEVIFGTPSQNCIGSGICMIMSRLPVRQPLRCPHTPAWIYFEQDRIFISKDIFLTLLTDIFIFQDFKHPFLFSAETLSTNPDWSL